MAGHAFDNPSVDNLIGDIENCNWLNDLAFFDQFELLDLQSNSELKTAHRENSLLDFYRKYLLLGNYPALSKHTMVYFSLFGSTYRCEQLFSQMKNVKNDRRQRLTDKHLADILRVATSTIEVDIDSIVKSKQTQTSH